MTLRNQSKAGVPTVEPVTQAFLDALAAQGGKGIHELSPTEARGVLSSVQSGTAVAKSAVDSVDRTIPGGATGTVRVRIVRPAGSAGSLPAIVYCHGGGWVLGDPDTHQRLMSELAAGAGAAVVFVDYERSPEARYPVALDQIYDTLEWVAKNGGEIGADGTRLAIAGDSVGGNMATAACLRAGQRGGPKIAFQALFYPVTDANFETPSYLEFGAGGYFLTTAGMRYFWDAYLPDPARRSDPLAAPLKALPGQLSGLPPALVITAEHDVLRDEGEAYARTLSAAGVRVTNARFNGTIHDFMMLNPLANTPAARGAVGLAVAELRAALHPTVERTRTAGH